MDRINSTDASCFDQFSLKYALNLMYNLYNVYFIPSFEKVSFSIHKVVEKYTPNVAGLYSEVTNMLSIPYTYISHEMEPVKSKISSIYNSEIHPAVYNICNNAFVLTASFSVAYLLYIFIIFSFVMIIGKYIKKKPRKITKSHYCCAFILSIIFFTINSIIAYPKSIFNIKELNFIRIVKVLQTPSTLPTEDFQLLGDDFYLTPLTFSLIFFLMSCHISILFFIDFVFENRLAAVITPCVEYIDRKINKEKYKKIENARKQDIFKKRAEELLKKYQKSSESPKSTGNDDDISSLFVDEKSSGSAKNNRNESVRIIDRGINGTDTEIVPNFEELQPSLEGRNNE